MSVVGITVAIGSGFLGYWPYCAIAGWAAACLTYLAWVWLAVRKMDASATSAHATREDPAQGTTDLLLVLASIASIVAVMFVLLQAKHATGSSKEALAVLVIVSVVLSWFLVHTLFAMRYARLYYTGGDGGVDFNQEEAPRYVDFAYLSFTIGMTFQVSDTDLQSHPFRATALRHGLLSYMFGAVILATTVNLIAGLA